MPCVFGIMLSLQQLAWGQLKGGLRRNELTCSKHGSVLISSCVTLGKTFYLSEPQFPLMYSGDDFYLLL